MTRRKVLLSLDDRLIDRIDRAAHERGVSRSAFIARIAERELGTRAPEEQRRIDEAHRRLQALGAKYGTSGEDSTEVVRRMRDERTRRLAR